MFPRSHLIQIYVLWSLLYNPHCNAKHDESRWANCDVFYEDIPKKVGEWCGRRWLCRAHYQMLSPGDARRVIAFHWRMIRQWGRRSRSSLPIAGAGAVVGGRSGRIGVKPLAANTSFLDVERDYSDSIERGVRSLWALQMWCVHLLPDLTVI